MASAPQVMISSTFYDLRQVRADLMRFIADEAGCTPLVSEEASFPVDPDLDAIENCRRRVEEEADILVLVMGGRYGSVDSKSARSVTNLEYLAAKAKGIPIYAFVLKDVLGLLPIWKKNPDADFSSAVDDPRIFDFIDQVRGIDAVWTVGFDLAQDIVGALRHRFAELMTEGLTFICHRRDEPTFRTGSISFLRAGAPWMPTMLSHPAVPLAARLGLDRELIARRLLALAIFCSMLPDVDVIGFWLGVPYGSWFRHRGFTHSLTFAALLASPLGVTNFFDP